jgi:hypothetical protein
MPIESRTELTDFIAQRLRFPMDVARTVATDVTFQNARFRAGGREFVAFWDQLRGNEIRLLLRELGYPRILWDHHPGPGGRCVPHDNSCCADYYGD